MSGFELALAGAVASGATQQLVSNMGPRSSGANPTFRYQDGINAQHLTNVTSYHRKLDKKGRLREETFTSNGGEYRSLQMNGKAGFPAESRASRISSMFKRKESTSVNTKGGVDFGNRSMYLDRSDTSSTYSGSSGSTAMSRTSSWVSDASDTRSMNSRMSSSAGPRYGQYGQPPRRNPVAAHPYYQPPTRQYGQTGYSSQW